MTATARVVVVQPLDRVEPEQPADVGQLRIEATPQLCFQSARDAPGETVPAERGAQRAIYIFRDGGAGRGRIHRTRIQVRAGAQRHGQAQPDRSAKTMLVLLHASPR